MMPIMAILTVLSGLLLAVEGDIMPVSTIWVSFAIMVVSIAGRIFLITYPASEERWAAFLCVPKNVWK